MIYMLMTAKKCSCSCLFEDALLCLVSSLSIPYSFVVVAVFSHWAAAWNTVTATSTAA